MSSSSEYSEFSGQKPAKLSEKSSSAFSQTCSLLSQYLKKKGSFGDLTLGITCKAEAAGSPETPCHSATTMNLFPTKENNVVPRNLSAMNSPSQQVVLPTLSNPRGIRTMEAKAAQLTIFYGGQVVVFDDFPADKAKELMLFASKGNPQSQNNSACTFAQTQTQPSFPNSPIPANVVNNSIEEHPQPPSRPVVCDLPIARKASLHRFLEKRKDRIAAKAPYQTNGPVPSKSSESQSWLGLAAQSPQI